MDKEKLGEQLAKMRKSLSNPNLSDSQKEMVKERIIQMEAQLAEAESQKEPEPNPAPEPKKAASGKKKITKDTVKPAVASCDPLLTRMEAVIKEFRPKTETKRSATPPKQKRVSTIIGDGISGTIRRVVKRSINSETIAKIKPSALRKARDYFSQGIREVRTALGGIGGDANTIVENFINQMNELIDEIEAKQKEKEKKEEKAA